MSQELEAITLRMNELEEQKDDIEGMIQALNSDLEDLSLEMSSCREYIHQLEERINSQEWEQQEDNDEEEDQTRDLQED